MVKFSTKFTHRDVCIRTTLLGHWGQCPWAGKSGIWTASSRTTLPCPVSSPKTLKNTWRINRVRPLRQTDGQRDVLRVPSWWWPRLAEVHVKLFGNSSFRIGYN